MPGVLQSQKSEITGEFSAWVWPWMNSGSGSQGGILHKSNLAGAGWQLMIGQQTDRMIFTVGFSNSDLHIESSGTRPLKLNSWNHVVVTWNGNADPTAGVRFYVDGVP